MRARGAVAMAMASTSRVYEYLKGAWALEKRVEYRVGGGFGTWRGEARFTPQDAGVLLLVEEGEFFFDSAPSRGVGLAAKPLTFDLRQPQMEVLFAEDPPRHFFSVDADALLEGPADFSHWCSPDTYSGEMHLVDDDHFLIDWTVSGPEKDGNIRQVFHRNKPTSSGVAATPSSR